jgi:hypothetical protein
MMTGDLLEQALFLGKNPSCSMQKIMILYLLSAHLSQTLLHTDEKYLLMHKDL